MERPQAIKREVETGHAEVTTDKVVPERGLFNRAPRATLVGMTGRPHLLLGAILLSLSPAFVQAQNGQPDPTIRVTLENAYNAWKNAMATQDLQRWEATTAFSRQIEIRNRIVSSRLPFPEALFTDPVAPPSLEGLISLGVLSTGFTATSTYFGRANFGQEPGLAPSDNMLVLHFLREEERWLFDNLRIVKIGDNSEILLKIRNQDFSFLQGAEFQPAKQLPPLAQPVGVPDFLAEAWVDSTGYEVKVTVNGHLTGNFTNIRVSELVIGGLRRGQNTVRIECLQVPEATGAKVEVAIYSAPGPGEPANRVFHFKPGAEIPPVYETSFGVE